MPATWGGGRLAGGRGETQGYSCMTSSLAPLGESCETD